MMGFLVPPIEYVRALLHALEPGIFDSSSGAIGPRALTTRSFLASGWGSAS